MVKIYSFLMVFSGLLLASCGRERTTQEAAATAVAPPLADTLRAVALPATETASSVVAGSGATDTAAGASASAPGVSLVPATGGQPVPRIKRGATVLADVPDAPVEPEANETEKAESTADLQRFLASGLPAAQTFSISPGRDTMVVGTQGTQVLIPAGIWELPTADSAAVVRLEMQEFYTPADMILAGLSTTAGPQLLETGGMLHLMATANGRPVLLRAGRFLHLRMPAKAPQPNMQVFEGVASETANRLDWRLPVLKAEPIDKPLVLQTGKGVHRRARHSPVHPKRRWNLTIHPGPQEPVYDGGDKQLRKDLMLSVEYSDGTRAWLRRGRRMTHDDYLALRRASTESGQRIVRIVTVTFDIDTTGAAVNPRFGARTDERLRKSVAAAVAQLALWEPAQLRTNKKWQAASSDRTITLYYPDTGPLIVKPGKWSPKVAIERLSAIRQARSAAERQARLLAEAPMRRLWQHRADSIGAVRQRYNDSLNVVLQAQAALERERLRNQFTDTATAVITEQGVYNELSTQGLSWINCDRFLARGPRITVGVDPGKPNAVVTLSFTRLKSIMRGDITDDRSVLFPHIPAGQAATIVALRREKGVTYLAMRSVQLSQQLLGGLLYHPVTMAELRAELAKL